MNPEQTQALLATVESLSKQVAALTEQQGKAPVLTPADRGGVWVEQWRTAEAFGKSIKVDETKQYYEAADYERLMKKDENDRNGFEHLHLSVKPIEDLRK